MEFQKLIHSIFKKQILKISALRQTLTLCTGISQITFNTELSIAYVNGYLTFRCVENFLTSHQHHGFVLTSTTSDRKVSFIYTKFLCCLALSKNVGDDTLITLS